MCSGSSYGPHTLAPWLSPCLPVSGVLRWPRSARGVCDHLRIPAGMRHTPIATLSRPTPDWLAAHPSTASSPGFRSSSLKAWPTVLCRYTGSSPPLCPRQTPPTPPCRCTFPRSECPAGWEVMCRAEAEAEKAAAKFDAAPRNPSGAKQWRVCALLAGAATHTEETLAYLKVSQTCCLWHAC